MPAKQVRNGKAFEYAIAISYYRYLSESKVDVTLNKNSAYIVAEKYFNELPKGEQYHFMEAASQTISTMLVIEPRLFTPIKKEALNISIVSDSAGIHGDVRDIIFLRKSGKKSWEIGFSAKNNHDAVKHSRLSGTLDFGHDWLGIKCRTQYLEKVNSIFDSLVITDDKLWKSMFKAGEKNSCLYAPILDNFREEMLRIYRMPDTKVPQKLLRYLIGKYPFYKIIKEDRYNQVIVKAFNINGELNKKPPKYKQKVKVQGIKLPERIISFDFKPDSKNTLLMVLDKGWQISFRIHTASSKFERSLKFDINLIGNPPVLFTQHLFAEDISISLPKA